jgi:hypothetical protein
MEQSLLERSTGNLGGGFPMKGNAAKASLNKKACTLTRAKPLITASLVERLLMRHVDFVSPESRLIVAVIKQGFIDLNAPSEHLRREACKFFKDDRLGLWSERVGISAHFVREIAVKGGFLPMEFMGLNGGTHA